ncbi:hypothetical protein AB0I28_19850 [Phytomonospora sp. NPDC050363]|uniref:3-dehydroquinate synthase family protein n=1 Tax=Phytomonospora sp. NPDC050363 TaxID=3155642 RepID=UPI0033EEC6EC
MPAETVALRIGDTRIPYLIGGVDAFLAAAKDLHADKWIVVASEQPTLRRYAQDLAEALSTIAPSSVITLGDGERFKSIATVERLCEKAVEAGATRSSVMVTVGGGNACNIGGLCASLLFRGIRLVQVPTTLMAMSDVVLSLKQGVNLTGMKNMLGTYHVAELIWADPQVLTTLPPQEVRAGLAEIIKNSLVLTPHHVDVLLATLNPAAEYTAGQLEKFLEMAIESKSLVLQHDPRERGRALVLEYGHTVGHALEALSSNRITHGFGVGLGMRVAARVSHRLGHLDEQSVAMHDRLLRRAGLPLGIPTYEDEFMTADRLRGKLICDNKRGYIGSADDQVAMVLLNRLGVPVTTAGVPLAVAPADMVVETACELLS